MRYFFLLAISAMLHADIQTTTLQFNPVNCQRNCADLLARQFQKVRGIRQVSINVNQGVINLSYAPNAPFSFAPLNTAVRVVGPNLESIQLTVRGRLEAKGNNVRLISLGDNTPFTILSPGNPRPNEMFIQESIFSHPLNPEQIAQLTALARAKKIVIISGPLLQPERSPPNNLIMQSLKVEEPEAK